MDYLNLKALKATVVFALFIFSSGCAKEYRFVRSTMLEPEKVSLIKEGSTSRDEVVATLGKPESSLSLDEGVETLFYKDNNLNSLWIQFDKNGIVTDIKYSGK